MRRFATVGHTLWPAENSAWRPRCRAQVTCRRFRTPNVDSRWVAHGPPATAPTGGVTASVTTPLRAAFTIRQAHGRATDLKVTAQHRQASLYMDVGPSAAPVLHGHTLIDPVTPRRSIVPAARKTASPCRLALTAVLEVLAGYARCRSLEPHKINLEISGHENVRSQDQQVTFQEPNDRHRG